MEISFLHSKTRKYKDLNGFTTRNHSISTTKGTAQGLIQRYKTCYSQSGVTQIYSGTKRLVIRRYGWSRTLQILFLHLLFSLICFATKIMPSLQRPWGGENHSFHPKKILTRLPPALYQDNQDGCDVRSKGVGLRDNKHLCCLQTLF